MKSYEERTRSILKKSEELKERRTKKLRLAGSSMGLAVCLAVAIAVPTGSLDKANPDSANLDDVVFASNYSQVYGAIQQVQNYSTNGYMRGGDFIVEESAPSDTAAPADGASSSMGESPMSTDKEKVKMDDGGTSDYSGTNVQVEGIDEGDIVKTNGEYIFALSPASLNVRILKADGENTEKISDFNVGKKFKESDSKNKDYYEYEEDSPFEMYVSGDTLAVLSQNYYNRYNYNGEMSMKVAGGIPDLNYINVNTVNVSFYDISDPANPTKKATSGQDGYNVSGRLIGDTLYVISNHSVMKPSDEGEPESFVPCVYREGERKAVAADCIAIMPRVDYLAYTVVSSYDMNTGEITSNQSVLGGGHTVYMNHDNLYVASSKYIENKGEPTTEGPYTVTEISTENNTSILRFSLKDGEVALKAKGEVSGELNDQFSMDENDGYLRLVTTVYKDYYTTYEDKAHDWTNYEWKEPVQNNSLYILDSKMDVVGSIEELAEDERIYSARFDGDIGYFVTFRQVDPLFSVDLSDPASPQILGELKIPGFSEYLHVYDDNLLFGLGKNADEKSGRTEDIKLSMFDVSDPTNVIEKHKLSIGEYYSDALYNHKAILISKKKDLIAFHAGDEYLIYGYDANRGFYQKAKIDTGEFGYNARGLYIGSFAYIVSDQQALVLDMDEYKVVKKISFK